GPVVFVDVTADWCITCKANKALVIDRGAVAARLRGTAVVAMRADWTRPDAKISAYLRSFGRFGIPFNAVYGPAAPAGIVLGELLTQGEVLAAMDTAAAPRLARGQ
ncbi:MAG: thioredoxin family protein, partial [Proteobacteria bacterium]|nr:thioredoxin family protein [Pseudomonadota bacterium]